MEILSESGQRKHGLGVILNHLEKDPRVISRKSELLNSFDRQLTVLRLPIVHLRAKAGR